MKKVIVAAFCFLLIIVFAFKPKNTLSVKANDVPSCVDRTLNGFTESQANSLVTFSFGTADNSPVNTQVWFNKRVVENWYKLLQADSIVKGIKSDGIRFYITRTLLSDTSIKHYNNAIVAVSTFDAGYIIKNGVKFFHHYDYFDHVDTASLFRTRGLRGSVTHYSDSTQGALLYNTCNCDNTTPCVIESDHTIARSQAEQMAQHFRRIIILRNGSINSRAEWFDKGMFKDLIAEWKADSVKGIKVDGVRIYFSRGMKKYSTTLPDSTIGKSKFVMVTTVGIKDLTLMITFIEIILIVPMLLKGANCYIYHSQTAVVVGTMMVSYAQLTALEPLYQVNKLIITLFCLYAALFNIKHDP